MKISEMNYVSLIAILVIVLFIVPQGSFADVVKGFDVNEAAHFSTVTVPVSYIQDAATLADHSALKKPSFNKKNSRDPASIQKETTIYFNNILAIGLTETEMKNLSVKPGDSLEVEANDRKITASVIKASGALRPPEATVNLSYGAALRLRVHPGDSIVINKVEFDRSLSQALPTMSKK